MKNCDQGFQNVAQGCLRPKSANNKFFSCRKVGLQLQMGLFTQLLSLNSLACRL